MKATATDQYIEATTALQGVGKSLSMVEDLVERKLLNDLDLMYWTNIQLNPGKIAEYVVQRHGKKIGCSQEEIEERLRVIPPEVIKTWEQGLSGPWEYFEGEDTTGYHLALDEAHHIVGTDAKVAYVEQWKAWLTDIRHNGMKIEFVTQNFTWLHKRIRDQVKLRRQLEAWEVQRDKFFKIQYEHWLELYGSIDRQFPRLISVSEKVQVDNTWKEIDRRNYREDKKYYPLYESRQRSQGSKSKKTIRRCEVWPTWKVWLWFARENRYKLIFNLITAYILLVVVAVLYFRPMVQWIQDLPKKALVAARQSGELHKAQQKMDSQVNLAQVKAPTNYGYSFADAPDYSGMSVDQKLADINNKLALVADIDSITSMRLRINQLEQEQRVMDQQAKDEVGLVLVNDRYVVLNDGRKYYLGEVVQAGALQGYELKAYDILKGQAWFQKGELRQVVYFPESIRSGKVLDNDSMRSAAQGLGVDLGGSF